MDDKQEPRTAQREAASGAPRHRAFAVLSPWAGLMALVAWLLVYRVVVLPDENASALGVILVATAVCALLSSVLAYLVTYRTAVPAVALVFIAGLPLLLGLAGYAFDAQNVLERGAEWKSSASFTSCVALVAGSLPRAVGAACAAGLLLGAGYASAFAADAQRNQARSRWGALIGGVASLPILATCVYAVVASIPFLFILPFWGLAITLGSVFAGSAIGRNPHANGRAASAVCCFALSAVAVQIALFSSIIARYPAGGLNDTSTAIFLYDALQRVEPLIEAEGYFLFGGGVLIFAVGAFALSRARPGASTWVSAVALVATLALVVVVIHLAQHSVTAKDLEVRAESSAPNGFDPLTLPLEPFFEMSSVRGRDGDYRVSPRTVWRGPEADSFNSWSQVLSEWSTILAEGEEIPRFAFDRRLTSEHVRDLLNLGRRGEPVAVELCAIWAQLAPQAIRTYASPGSLLESALEGQAFGCVRITLGAVPPDPSSGASVVLGQEALLVSNRGPTERKSYESRDLWGGARPPRFVNVSFQAELTTPELFVRLLWLENHAGAEIRWGARELGESDDR